MAVPRDDAPTAAPEVAARGGCAVVVVVVRAAAAVAVEAPVLGAGNDSKGGHAASSGRDPSYRSTSCPDRCVLRFADWDPFQSLRLYHYLHLGYLLRLEDRPCLGEAAAVPTRTWDSQTYHTAEQEPVWA